MITFHPDHIAFLELLEKYTVHYMVIGGYAVQFHGVERPTTDLDLWVYAGEENLACLKGALSEFGYPQPDVIDRLANDPGLTQILGQPEASIELMTHLDLVDFTDCYMHAVEMELNQITVPIISKFDLIAYKKAYGRPKDLADIKKLRQ